MAIRKLEDFAIGESVKTNRNTKMVIIYKNEEKVILIERLKKGSYPSDIIERKYPQNTEVVGNKIKKWCFSPKYIEKGSKLYQEYNQILEEAMG